MTHLPLTLIFVSTILHQICCYENLSRKSCTVLTQSSTADNQVASLANDGDLRTTFRYCAHTVAGQNIAWFQVDVRSPYNILNVKIYYRNDGNVTGDYKQYRFRQFYLDVSDSPATQTRTSQRTRCYTDNTTYPNVPPNIIEIPCKHTARYVIVETTYDPPEDQDRGPILEICEIEVYGCRLGTWGYNCTGVCRNCQNGECDVQNGFCTKGCVRGWKGDTCNIMCGRCATGSCEQHTGACSDGCVQNWTGDQCDTQQVSGTTTNTQPFLYGVAAVLCLSLGLNIISFTWIFRKVILKRKNEIAVPIVVYDSVEDNTGYQELGQLSGPSIYDEIQKEK